MKMIIIEDEPKAADQLLHLIQVCDPTMECQARIESVEDSLEWFQNGNETDLIFMDIQLGDGLSFEIFQSIEIKTSIIFTTAFDKYAIRAFKVNSIDYLLKPVQKEELKNALDKFKSTKENTVDHDVLLSILNRMKNPENNSAFLVKEGSGFIRLLSDDIDYFYSEDSLSFAMSKGRRFLINKTIDQIMAHISSSQFFRINRGQIIAIKSVSKIEPYFNHRLILNLFSSKGEQFIVSRAKVAEFKDWIETGI